MTTHNHLVPAIVTHPGEDIKDELEARGISQSDFAEIIGRPLKTVNAIIKGKKSITPETASAIAAVFGTSAEMWLGMQAEYDLFVLGKEGNNFTEVKERSELYDRVPVRELIKRGYLEKTNEIGNLFAQIKKILNINNLSDLDKTCAAFRKSEHGKINQKYIASWVNLGKNLSSKIKVAKFDKKALKKLTEELKNRELNEKEISQVIKDLNKCGVTVLILPHFQHTKVDGAILWNNDKPIVLLSLRYDRIDNFYFNLLHEIGHILLHDNKQDHLDLEIGESNEKVEEEANKFARYVLLGQANLESLAKIKWDNFSVNFFAKKFMRHPGILVGLLQGAKIVQYSYYRKYLVKIKSFLPSETVCN